MGLGFLQIETTEGEEIYVFSAWNFPFGGKSLPQTGCGFEKCADFACGCGLTYS
jgi:hypothetical protein